MKTLQEKPSAIKNLQHLLKDEMPLVNQKILTHMHSPIEMIPTLAGHLIQSGGKRLRPMLVLSSAKALGYEGSRHIGLAASVEFIHTATLLHDDVVDESDTRRGIETSNSIWGNKASVLVGDFLFSRAFQLMVEDGNLETLSILADASATIAQGEVLQLTTAQNLDTTMATYQKVIEHKTATLFAAAMQLGTILAQQQHMYGQAFRSYGMHLGMAFQMIDDILDYEADTATLGKKSGDDFKEGKITLPVILAYANASGAEKAFWQRCMAEKKQEEQDFITAKKILKDGKYLETAREIAQGEASKAADIMSALPKTAYSQCLKDIAHQSIERTF